MDDAFEDHYSRTPDLPRLYEEMRQADPDSAYEWHREGMPVNEAIAKAVVISEKIAGDVQEILENKHADLEADQMGVETPFADSSYYELTRPGSWMWNEAWRSFVQSIKTQARFFNQVATTHLNKLFEGVEGMQSREGQPVIVNAGPGTSISSLFRARVFQSTEKLKEAMCWPDREIGPPPAPKANAGRMNAQGISIFYGANDGAVALAEVRAPVGSWVMVAKFTIERPLRLLDLNALRTVHSTGSIFDPEYGRQLSREAFLRRLTTLITQPVMPDDEDFEYLATQAIADYLASSTALRLDGIIYPSAQVEGQSLNIALFHKAARVKEITVPKGTELDAQIERETEDGFDPEYSVIVWAPKLDEERPLESNEDFTFHLNELAFDSPELIDDRQFSLSVDTESLVVHEVRRVVIVSDVYQVNRKAYIKTEAEF